MECGVPFCHNGCPLGNLIPDWNDLVYRDRWQDAIRQLHATNNFPEFTGRLCPAPCEAACVLEIREGDAVTIKQIENSIIDRAWDEGWVVPQPPAGRDRPHGRRRRRRPGGHGRRAAAAPRGPRVVLFERDEAAGGLVRFGVPDFKIEKWVVERRVEQLRAEGVELRCGVDVGVDITVDELRAEFDAVVLTTGSRVPRDLPVPGRELDGIHFAMDYLYDRTRQIRDAGRRSPARSPRRASTSSSSAAATPAPTASGNSLREGALASPSSSCCPSRRATAPTTARRGRCGPRSTACPTRWRRPRRSGRASRTTRSPRPRSSDRGRVRGTRAGDQARRRARRRSRRSTGTEQELQADLVLLAMGFLHPEPELLDGLGVAKDPRGNAAAPAYATSVHGVFAAGDCRRGQSLIVWAINEGRQAARMGDRYLGSLDPLAGRTPTPTAAPPLRRRARPPAPWSSRRRTTAVGGSLTRPCRDAATPATAVGSGRSTSPRRLRSPAPRAGGRRFAFGTSIASRLRARRRCRRCACRRAATPAWSRRACAGVRPSP